MKSKYLKLSRPDLESDIKNLWEIIDDFILECLPMLVYMVMTQSGA